MRRLSGPTRGLQRNKCDDRGENKKWKWWGPMVEKITSVKPLPKAEKVKIGKWKWWWGYPGQPTRGWENNNKCEGRESESEKFKGKVMRRLTYFLRWSYYILCPICHLSWSILEKLTHPCCWRSVSLPMWVEMPSGGLVRINTMIMWVDVGFISHKIVMINLVRINTMIISVGFIN